jgi:hypothetical protein
MNNKKKKKKKKNYNTGKIFFPKKMKILTIILKFKITIPIKNTTPQSLPVFILFQIMKIIFLIAMKISLKMIVNK